VVMTCVVGGVGGYGSGGGGSSCSSSSNSSSIDFKVVSTSLVIHCFRSCLIYWCGNWKCVLI